MADTTNEPSDLSDMPDRSVWGDEFKIAALKADPVRWNKNWEKALRTRPAADAFARMGFIHKKNRDVEELVSMFAKELVTKQEVLIMLWTMGGDRRLGGKVNTAWMLLTEDERTKHLNKGFEDAFMHVVGRQDARGLAPEITTSALLKRNGKAFLDFSELYMKGKENVGAGNAYFHPSVWWDKALKELPESFLEGLNPRAYEILTVQRNDFITKFLLYVGLSVVGDLSSGSAGMEQAIGLMSTDPSIANSLANTLASVRDKPLVRCQNCSETQEEDGKKFMLCSMCKSKLDFPIHYCSAKCQQEDWSNHRKHCGKKKVAKQLVGTIHDPFWFQPGVPDTLRNLPTDSNGNVTMSTLGFGNPAYTPSYSAALQRQVNLLTADKDADYFLFDGLDRPVRFVIHDRPLKMNFRLTRTEVLSSDDPNGVEVLVECIIKMMGHKPGLSRDRIIAQFSKEYERDVVGKLDYLESTHAGNPGVTVLESLSRSMTDFVPSVRSIFA